MAQQESLNILEFQRRFGTDDACRNHLFKIRWPLRLLRIMRWSRLCQLDSHKREFGEKRPMSFCAYFAFFSIRSTI